MVFSESVKADNWTRKHELSVYLGRYIVESTAEFRVESVLWQEDDRVILVEKAYYLAEKRWPANYAQNEKCSIRSRNCVAFIDYCHRTSAIVW